jgi:hypothetical protein
MSARHSAGMTESKEPREETDETLDDEVKDERSKGIKATERGIPKLDLESSMEGLSLSKRKLVAAKMQDIQIVDAENKVLVRKMSEQLVNAAFKDVAHELWLNTPRAEK